MCLFFLFNLLVKLCYLVWLFAHVRIHLLIWVALCQFCKSFFHPFINVFISFDSLKNDDNVITLNIITQKFFFKFLKICFFLCESYVIKKRDSKIWLETKIQRTMKLMNLWWSFCMVWNMSLELIYFQSLAHTFVGWKFQGSKVR